MRLSAVCALRLVIVLCVIAGTRSAAVENGQERRLPAGVNEKQKSERLFPKKKPEQNSPKLQVVAAHQQVEKTKLKRRKLPAGSELAGGIAAAIVGGLLLLWGVSMWWRARARFYFPALHVESRLGGDHAAGIGAVISFASASVPPAIQRNQLPDYLRRA